VLDAVHAKDPRTPVVIVTGTGSEEIAIEAMKRGAADYVIKTPKHIQHLPHTIHAVLEKKQAEAALVLSEERFRTIIELAADALSLINADGTIIYSSPSISHVLGHVTQERIGHSAAELIYPEDLPATRELLRQILERPGESLNLEMRMRHKDGRWLWFATTLTNLLEHSAVRAIVSRSRDITERKHAEERIQQQLARLSALSAIDRAITASFELRLTLDIFLAHVTAQLGVDAAAVLLLNPQLHVLEFKAGRGFRGRGITQLRLRLGEDHAGKAALERRLVNVPNLTKAKQPLSKAELTAHEGFIAYYALPLIAKGEVKGVLEIFQRAPLNPDQEWLNFFEALAGQAAIAIDSAQLFEGLQRSNAELTLSYDATIAGWSAALDLRDKETEGHSQRVTDLTLHLAQSMGMSAEELMQVRRGALLHDMGKMGVPDGILLKPGKLTDEEWVAMRKHPQFAYDLLSPIAFLRPALDIPYCHHEKWDGTGYPRGLQGEQIPLSARLFAIVDVYDALTSERPYRAAWSKEKTLAHIQSLGGTHFDPKAVAHFLSMISQPARRDDP
jgi:PAS domain S-box-containing protein